MRGGDKIEAIKLYREATGVGLKESKEAVEAIEAEARGSQPDQLRVGGQKKGCLGLFAVLLATAATLGWWLAQA